MHKQNTNDSNEGVYERIQCTPLHMNQCNEDEIFTNFISLEGGPGQCGVIETRGDARHEKSKGNEMESKGKMEGVAAIEGEKGKHDE